MVAIEISISRQTPRKVFWAPFLLFCAGALWVKLRTGVPSTVSIGRFLSVWYLPVLARNEENFLLLVAAICAASSDWVDGALARKWKCASDTGGFFDLLGDKGLSLTLMYLGLGVWDNAWWYLTPCAVLLTYHTTVMGMRVLKKLKNRSSRVAKIKFFLEATGWVMCFSSFSLGSMFVWADWIGLALVWISSCLAAWSMLEYWELVQDWPKRFYPRKSW